MDATTNCFPRGCILNTLTARDPELHDILFEETRVATIDCPTPADGESWGRIKGRYVE